ncbi:hypothetical protein K3495_g3799 [Podosphaera aphanis]|nr:hypothetical protein K3495_g3799 [Podosphaera aphanis]
MTYKANIHKARYEPLERTAEIRRIVETTTMATTNTAAQKTTDQGFTVVTNKPEGLKRSPGHPRKEKIPTTTAATQKNDVKSLASTSSTPNFTAIPKKDGEFYFT